MAAADRADKAEATAKPHRARAHGAGGCESTGFRLSAARIWDDPISGTYASHLHMSSRDRGTLHSRSGEEDENAHTLMRTGGSHGGHSRLPTTEEMHDER